MVYNIFDYGAVGDGIHNDGAAINAAIAECARTGGRVLVPGGNTYLSGSIVLKSGIDFHVEKGATIVGIKEIDQYNYFKDLADLDTTMEVPSYVNCEYDGRPKQYFIYAKDADNLTISGEGVIDGSEEIYYGKREPGFIDGSYYPRIPLIYLEHCTNLTIRDITFSRSGFWTTHMIGCEYVKIDNLKIFNNMELANCDGIDPDHCKHMEITNCHIRCADDCIVFKNTGAYRHYGKCEDIIVKNCRLESASAAVKFGTETEGEFENIHVSDCVVSGQRGISFQLRDDGIIKNATFTNIRIATKLASHIWWGRAEAIAITALDRKEGVHAGRISNILFKDIESEGENGIFVHGNPGEMNIYDVSFKNITMKFTNLTEYPKNGHDLRPCKYDETYEDVFAPVYIKNARNINLENIAYEADREFLDVMETPVYTENTDNIAIEEGLK